MIQFLHETFYPTPWWLIACLIVMGAEIALMGILYLGDRQKVRRLEKSSNL